MTKLNREFGTATVQITLHCLEQTVGGPGSVQVERGGRGRRGGAPHRAARPAVHVPRHAHRHQLRRHPHRAGRAQRAVLRPSSEDGDVAGVGRQAADAAPAAIDNLAVRCVLVLRLCPRASSRQSASQSRREGIPRGRREAPPVGSGCAPAETPQPSPAPREAARRMAQHQRRPAPRHPARRTPRWNRDRGWWCTDGARRVR